MYLFDFFLYLIKSYLTLSKGDLIKSPIRHFLHLKEMAKDKEHYESGFLEKQVSYYRSLPEKQRRHFLAMEYERLGVGSKRYLARVFGCDRKTINKGLRELADDNYQADYTRQRRVGGGRKKKKS